jgi:uncharacterized CHY-type Zn-finger protein
MHVQGRPLDAATRCAHWHGPLDIVAFRFACCEGWWPCHACHEETSDHPALPWPRSRTQEPSVLCGACGTPMTVIEYVGAHDACPTCGAGFNPGCRAHHGLYFE